MHPVKPIVAKFPDPAWFADVSIVPLFIEPVLYSGKRICVGVVAADKSGPKFRPINLGRLRAIYGSGQPILEFAAMSGLNSLVAHVDAHGMTEAGLRLWQPPVEGLFVGEPTHTSSKSVESALELYLTKHSSVEATALEADVEAD